MFSPDLDDPVSRIRLGVGDITSSELFKDSLYEALLLAAGNDEAAATKSVAAALAAYYANQPSTLTSKGSTLTWAERIKQWNAIALGTVGSTVPTTTTSSTSDNDPPSGTACTQAVW